MFPQDAGLASLEQDPWLFNMVGTTISVSFSHGRQARDKLVLWATKTSPFMRSGQVGTESAKIPFPFLLSQLTSALLLRLNTTKNKEIPSFFPTSAGRLSDPNSTK